jgi:hypothetical protein
MLLDPARLSLKNAYRCDIVFAVVTAHCTSNFFMYQIQCPNSNINDSIPLLLSSDEATVSTYH